ncbi:MAG: polysaccharide pyruvyl transferase family protein [Gemmatimonadota bacterium]|nr:polysaccharide pyruvyl transferase family protein [Gemmatimonadota bacterium]
MNAYSAQNMGDAAINLATVALVRAHGAATVRTAGRYHRHDDAFYAQHDIATVSPAIPFGPPGDGSLPLRALQFAAGTIWAALLLIPLTLGLPDLSESLARWANADGLLELLTADVVVLAGGGYLFSARRRINASLIHSLAVIWLALAARKRLVMMPQSIGPLKGSFDRWIVKKTLAHVSPIVVREQTAFAELTALMHPADLRLCPDVALYGWPPQQALAPRRTGRPTVGVLVMDWTWARATSRRGLDRYRQELLTLITDLGRADVDVVLLGGCKLPELGQDDMVVAREIADLVAAATGRAPALAEASDPDAFRSRLATLDVVVGTRLHSCLLALACGVPAIALGYQPKTAGSYELLGLPELYHDVEAFTAADVGRQVNAILRDQTAWNDRVAGAAARARAQIEKLYDELL